MSGLRPRTGGVGDAAPPAFGWVILAIAGALEVAWLVALQRSDGFSQPLYGAISIFLAWLSFFLLSIALRSIPAGTAYADRRRRGLRRRCRHRALR